MGQTHVQAYITHPAALEDAPAMYKKFRDKHDGVMMRAGPTAVYRGGSFEPDPNRLQCRLLDRLHARWNDRSAAVAR